MSGTNRIIKSENAKNKSSESSLTHDLTNANEEAIKIENKKNKGNK